MVRAKKQNVLKDRGSITEESNDAIRLLGPIDMDERPLNFKNRMMFISCLFFTILFLFYYEEYLEKTTRLATVPEYYGFVGKNSNNMVVKWRNKTIKKKMPACPENLTITNVRIHKNINSSFIIGLNKTLQEVIRMGGYYVPSHCQPRYKVAILVPIRDRVEDLQIFLFNMHPFLMRQNLEYRIFVIEQTPEASLNKGRLYNAGFLEIQKMGDWQCVVFQDVDLLPTDDRIRYSCSELPTLLYAYDIKNLSDYTMNRSRAVIAMTVEHYRMVNGYSNAYWRWGGEDEDIMLRFKAAALNVYNYDKEKTWSTPTPEITRKKQRMQLLENAVERYKKDGLSNVYYKKICDAIRPLYTKIFIDVNPPESNYNPPVTGDDEHVPPVFYK